MGLRPGLDYRYKSRSQEPTNRPHDKHSDRRRFDAMLPIEQAIVDRLRSGPCCFDDIVTDLPNFSWGEVFVAVDCMSRDGRVSLIYIGYSTYQVSLGSRFAYSGSTS